MNLLSQRLELFRRRWTDRGAAATKVGKPGLTAEAPTSFLPRAARGRCYEKSGPMLLSSSIRQTTIKEESNENSSDPQRKDYHS